MLVWEVVRNAEKNFTDDFDKTYNDTDVYQNLDHYKCFSKKYRGSNQKEDWGKESKEFHVKS